MAFGLGDLDHATLSVFSQFFSRFDILPDGDPDVLKRLFLAHALRPAARQAGARDAKAFFGLAENDAISRHGSHVTPNLMAVRVLHAKPGNGESVTR